MRKFREAGSTEFKTAVSRWRRSGLAAALILVLACFLMGNDQYNAYALVKKHRASLSDKEITRYRETSKPVPAWLLSSAMPGGDLCANATPVTVSPFNDTGNTTGSNNTVSNYNRPSLAFPYPGPDQYYRIVLSTAGSIGASMSLTGSTLDGALFLTNVCPAGTAQTIPAANSLGNSQDSIGGGVGPEVLPVTNVPAGIYFIGIDSYYAAGPNSVGTYSITITSVGVTAASVTVSGRVLNQEGRAVRNATVSITDQAGNTRTAIAGPRGNYLFEDVEAGQTYVVTAASRRYTFTPRVVEVGDSVSDLDITANP